MNPKRRYNFFTGTKLEHKIGYARAVRIGYFIEVSGTTAINEENEVVGGDDVYQQAYFILAKINSAITEAGGSIKDVIRTRIHLKNIEDWEDVAKAHAQFFGEIRPACSVVEVSNLINDKLLVEIEASAVMMPKE